MPLTTALSPRQTYEFDVRGYFRLHGLIPPGDVARMNALIDDRQRACSCRPTRFPLLGIDRIFWDLMTHPTVLAIARHLCGDHFRIDHAYGLQYPPAGPKPDHHENLHGGPRANQGSFFYQWFGEQSRVGLLVFGFALEPAGPGDGGLVLVPGSHKGSMALEGRDVWERVVGKSHSNALCHQPVLEAGDVVVFTESLVHGTAHWKNRAHRRRNLYYKYCPGHLCWRSYEQWGRDAYRAARTDVERSLLRPPFVAAYDEDDVTMSGDNHWREPTCVKPRVDEGSHDGQEA